MKINNVKTKRKNAIRKCASIAVNECLCGALKLFLLLLCAHCVHTVNEYTYIYLY